MAFIGLFPCVRIDLDERFDLDKDLYECKCIDDLIVATRILVNEQVIDGFGHASVRDPNRSDRYFMTRDNFGGADGEDYIVELDLDSNSCKPNGPKLSLERFIHGEIYRAR